MRLTPAQKRALRKAISNRFVMAAGGFGEPGDPGDPIDDPHFDRQSVIDHCIKAGALTWGAGSNQYVPTMTGMVALSPRRRTPSQRGRNSA